MNFHRRPELVSLVLAFGLVGFVACGGSDDEPFTASGGTGGKAGAGGSAGAAAGGSAGAAAGGSSGAAAGGTAGAAGSAGAGGQAGSGADAGGDASTGGSGGSASDAGADSGCVDPLSEPNETEGAASAVAGTDDCDSEQSVTGILAGSDVDWYELAGTDNLLSCSPNPKASVDQSGLDVCVYAQCQNGTTGVTCAKGTSSTSPGGRSGCCAKGGPAEISLTCSGLGAANADVYVQVKQSGNACVPYKLTYSY